MAKPKAGGLTLSASWFRGFAFSTGQPTVQTEGATITWPGIVAVVLLAGAAFGLLSLALGLWALQRYRQRSSPINDLQLRLLVESIQKEIGCPRGVVLRECADLATPATLGCFHPVILLPADWRDWSDLERRAVLAHELAHICRHDYLTSLLACLSVALHFYHPLVRWLAGRLRLQQELAADELGARVAGGRAPYLLALAHLALRQDGRLLSWPAGSFFSTPGTLLRRIAMLRAKEGARPVSRWVRLVPVALLIAATLGLSALRSPAQKTDENYSVKLSEKGSSKEPAPFDLSYIPADALGVYGYRPNVLALPEMKATTAKINNLIAMQLKALQLPEKGLPLIEEVEQVVGTVKFLTDPTQKEHAGFVLTLNMLRTVKPFDWHKAMKEYAPTATEMKYKDRVYYMGASKLFGGNEHFCFYIPNDRTIVFDGEANLQKLLEAAPVDRLAAMPWAADWKRLERGTLAMIIDNHKGAWSKVNAMRTVKTRNMFDFPAIDEIRWSAVDEIRWTAQGLTIGKDLEIQMIAQMKGKAEAANLVKESEKRLDEKRGNLKTYKPHAATPKEVVASDAFCRELLAKMSVKPEGERVLFHGVSQSDLFYKFIESMLP